MVHDSTDSQILIQDVDLLLSCTIIVMIMKGPSTVDCVYRALCWGKNRFSKASLRASFSFLHL